MSIQVYEHIDHLGNLNRRITLGNHSREFTVTRRQLENDGIDFIELRMGYEVSILESAAERDKEGAK